MISPFFILFLVSFLCAAFQTQRIRCHDQTVVTPPFLFPPTTMFQYRPTTPFTSTSNPSCRITLSQWWLNWPRSPDWNLKTSTNATERRRTGGQGREKDQTKYVADYRILSHLTPIPPSGHKTCFRLWCRLPDLGLTFTWRACCLSFCCKIVLPTIPVQFSTVD